MDKDYEVLLPERVLNYLESLTNLGYSRGIYTTNRKHLYLYTQYLGDIPINRAKHKDVTDFIPWVSENYPKYSTGTICNILKSIRKYYRREKELGHIFEDPFTYIKGPRVPRILPRNVPKDRDIKKLISVIPKKRYRDRAIIELLYGSGIRAGELLGIRLTDIDFDRRLVKVIDSKSKKERFVPVNDLTLYSIDEYLNKERPTLLKSKPARITDKDTREKAEEYLFLKRGGFRLCTWRLSTLIEKYRKESEIGFKLSPHSFRHACATEMLKGGASIRHIQTMLGHNSISTTMIYTKLGIDELKIVLDNFHLHGGRV